MITMANSAKGWIRAIGPAFVILVLAWPYVLFTPMLSTRIMLLARSELVPAGILVDLYRHDKFLFILVGIFGIVLPVGKSFLIAITWYCAPALTFRRMAPIFSAVSKLGLLDLFVAANVIIAVKGVGVAAIRILPGFYFFAAVAISTLALNMVIDGLVMSRNLPDDAGRDEQ
jgi:hypothetical protein